MVDRAAPLRIARLRVRAPSAEAAQAIAAEFGGATFSAPSAPAARRVTLEADGRGAARALGAYLSGGRDG